jgi:hypothetical protein
MERETNLNREEDHSERSSGEDEHDNGRSQKETGRSSSTVTNSELLISKVRDPILIASGDVFVRTDPQTGELIPYSRPDDEVYQETCSWLSRLSKVPPKDFFGGRDGG